MKNIKVTLLLILSLLAFNLTPAAQAQSTAPIPWAGYQDVLPGDPESIEAPQYTYTAIVKEVYDSDTLNIDLDVGFDFWRRDLNVRLAGTNAFEIKKSRSKRFRGRSIGSTHVKTGFECRDLMIGWLGGNPSHYPRRVKYHNLLRPDGLNVVPDAPIKWVEDGGPRVIVQTIGDASGKFGRPLVIIWKNGNNLNQWLVRSGCADLNWYDGEEYEVTSPIVPR